MFWNYFNETIHSHTLHMHATRMAPSLNTPTTLTHTRKVVRVNWDGTKVTDNEVHDYLPTLVRSAAVKPCLLVLDDIWNSKQVSQATSSL